jgi:hypothetical protein
VTAHANEARDAAVQEASARARADAEALAHVEIARLEGRLEEMNEASASLARDHAADVAANVAARQRLVDAVRALDRASSLSDILNALVDGASLEAARVGLLLVRNGELRGWRFAGFGPAMEPARSVAVRAEDNGIIAEAVRTGVAVSSDATSALAAPAFAELPGDRERLAVPVIVSGDVAAVLYADQGSGEPTDGRSSTLRWPAALEVCARHASRCLEAATAIRAVRVLTDPPEIPDRASPTVVDGTPRGRAGADQRAP